MNEITRIVDRVCVCREHFWNIFDNVREESFRLWAELMLNQFARFTLKSFNMRLIAKAGLLYFSWQKSILSFEQNRDNFLITFTGELYTLLYI